MTSVRHAQRERFGDITSLTVCKICGKECVGLAQHVVAAHGMLARDYKIKFGLPLMVGLTSPSLHQKLKAIREDVHAADPMLRVRMAVKVVPGSQRAFPGQEPGATWRGSATYLAKHRAAKAKLCDDRRDRLTDLWLSGTPVKQIAAEFGCNESTVANHRRKLNLPAREQVMVLSKAQPAHPLPCSPSPAS